MTPQVLLNILNEAVQLDPSAIHKLVEARVDCNQDLEIKSELVVSGKPDGTCCVGLLGVLNALLLRDGEVLVAFYNNDKLTHFELRPAHKPSPGVVRQTGFDHFPLGEE